MANPRIDGLLQHVRAALTERKFGSDAELLDRFIVHGDEKAFAALMQRHAPLVLGVCRRVLRHDQDAEDVFQATFLVLARRAGAIRRRASLASWLYGVAYRLALKAQAAAARRSLHEKQLPPPAPRDSAADVTWGELRQVLDEELARLPEKFRAPLLLCYFNGQTQDEASRLLGCKARTFKARLARARGLLRGRLERRGLTLSTALVGPLLGPEVPSASTVLCQSTVQAAKLFAARGALSGAVSVRVLALVEGGLRAMFVTKLLVVSVALSALAFLAGGAALVASRAGPTTAIPVTAPAENTEQGQLTDRWGDPLPQGAIARLGTVRYRYQAIGAAFLPDDETVVSAKEDGAIQLWAAHTGRLVREIKPGQLQIRRAFAVSRDGKSVAVSGSLSEPPNFVWRSVVRVYDVSTGKEVRTFERDLRDGVETLALTPDGKFLLTLGGEGKLRVEEVATGLELLEHQFPGDIQPHLALSRDGSTLALASGPNSRKLFVWKWQTAEEPREFRTAAGYRGGRVAFSADGKLLADCSDIDPVVRIWDVQSARLLRKLQLPDLESYRHGHIVFSPDGKMMAASGISANGLNSAVHLWNPVTGEFLRRLDLGGGPLDFSSNGRLLVDGSRVWDFVAGRELSANDQAPWGEVLRIATGDRGLVVTICGEKEICIWDVASGRLQRRLAQDGWIRDIALSPSGTKLVSSSLTDNLVCLWDTATGKKIFELPGHGRLGGRRAVAFTPDGKFFFSWGDDMYLRQWSVKTGKVFLENAIRPTGIPVPGEDEEEAIRRHMVFEGIMNGIFSPDAKHLDLQSMDQVFVFEVATGRELRHFSREGGYSSGQAVSADGRLLLTSTFGKSVQTKLPDGMIQSSTPMYHLVSLWDLDAGQLKKQLSVPEQMAGPVAFSPTGKLFAEASSKPGAHIRVWDLSGQTVWAAEGFAGVVRSLAFMPDGKQLISGMDNSTALVWDITQKP